MPIPVTLLYGGLTALLVVLLGLNVSRARGKLKAHFGTAPDEMTRELRAHGNAAEWAPLGILLLLLLELAGVSSLALHVLGGSLVLGRVLHAAGALIRQRTPFVTLGATVNYLVTAVLAGWAVALHFR
jgi:uncharacterized membrane protein YecN with MAPEG domain